MMDGFGPSQSSLNGGTPPLVEILEDADPVLATPTGPDDGPGEGPVLGGPDESSVLQQVSGNGLSPAARKEAARVRYSENPALAQCFLERYKSVREGFCWVTTNKPTKEGGYVQCQDDGSGKFCNLGTMLLWAAGESPVEGLQTSHRCNHPKCTIPDHVRRETPAYNNGRKNCLVWIDCHCEVGCEFRILVCPHQPSCIKYVPGYETWEEFIKWGLH